MSDFRLDINRNIGPIARPKVIAPRSYQVDKSKSFEDILKKQISKEGIVKFSKHAQERLERRNIRLTSQDIENISHAVEKAASKGIKDTLIIMKNTALIANVKSKTIITAATEESLKDSIFTNIDGAVII